MPHLRSEQQSEHLSQLEQLGHLYHEAPIGMCHVDRDLRYVRINRALAAFNGLPIEDHIGRTIREVIPELADEVEADYRRVLETGEPIEVELSGVTAAEPEVEQHWAVSYFPRKDDRGKLVGVSTIVVDVTERKKTEMALQRRLQFEHLVSDLSARMIRVAPGEVADEIDRCLALLGEHMGVDRTYLLQFVDARETVRVTHMWFGKDVQIDEEILEVDIGTRFPWLTDHIHRNDPVIVSNVDDLPDQAGGEKEYCLLTGIVSFLMAPMSVGDEVIGMIGFDAMQLRQWSPDVIQRLRLVGEIFANALAREKREIELAGALTEIGELSKRLEAENLYLREEIKVQHDHSGIVAESPAIRQVLRIAERVAATDATVLLSGETGTGKEILARAIHDSSPRKDRPMVKVNCAALPSTLIESELFGREKGAYTGAESRQFGRFEVADQSTIFLDEISELPFELQPKLLRVLQEGQFERLGSSSPVQVDVRVIAATNRDLSEAVRSGRFREDLFYRLNVVPISVPPLRERIEDIQPLVWSFVREFSETRGRRVESIAKKSMDALLRYPWPGNVRELRNVVERATIMGTGPELRIEVAPSESTRARHAATLDEVQRRHILEVLERTGWRIRGSGGASQILGLKPTTLESRMARLDIVKRAKFSDISEPTRNAGGT